jgi:hypothetical protein
LVRAEEVLTIDAATMAMRLDNAVVAVVVKLEQPS